MSGTGLCSMSQYTEVIYISPNLTVLRMAVAMSPEQNSGAGHMFKWVEQTKAALVISASGSMITVAPGRLITFCKKTQGS